MSFRERIAWICVVTTILVWGGFFGFMAVTGGRMPGQVYLSGFIGAVIVQVVLMVVASVVAVLMARRDADTGADERDRAIARSAYAVAYPVLLALVFCVAGTLHLGFSARDMAYAIMGAIVLAEIVHYAAQIVAYRRTA